MRWRIPVMPVLLKKRRENNMAETVKIKGRREALRGMSEAELVTVVSDAHKKIYGFRKDRLSKPQENVKIVRTARKEIARALTIKRERELAGDKG